MGHAMYTKMLQVSSMSILIFIKNIIERVSEPGGFLPWWFFPNIYKITVLNLFSVALRLIGDLFVPPHYCM